MSIPWLTDGDLQWDSLLLGGEPWPGIATVEVTAERSVDAQKKKGDDGANLVDQGYEPAKVRITLRLWLKSQWVELQRLLPTVHPRKKGGVRTPVDIAHPTTQLIGVRQIYITAVGPPTAGTGAETGSLEFPLEAIEWFPAPKPAKPKTNKSKADPTGGELPDYADPGFLPPDQDGSPQTNGPLPL